MNKKIVYVNKKQVFNLLNEKVENGILTKAEAFDIYDKIITKEKELGDLINSI